METNGKRTKVVWYALLYLTGKIKWKTLPRIKKKCEIYCWLNIMEPNHANHMIRESYDSR